MHAHGWLRTAIVNFQALQQCCRSKANLPNNNKPAQRRRTCSPPCWRSNKDNLGPEQQQNSPAPPHLFSTLLAQFMQEQAGPQ